MMKEVRDAEQADVGASDTPEPSATASIASDVTEIELKLWESLVDHASTLDGLATIVDLHKEAARFHLGELEHKQMVLVRRNVSPHVPTIYALAHEGSRVLIEAGLLK